MKIRNYGQEGRHVSCKTKTKKLPCSELAADHLLHPPTFSCSPLLPFSLSFFFHLAPSLNNNCTAETCPVYIPALRQDERSRAVCSFRRAVAACYRCFSSIAARCASLLSVCASIINAFSSFVLKGAPVRAKVERVHLDESARTKTRT